MGKSRTATNKSGAGSSRDSSSPSRDQRFSSSSDLWPEVAPEESSRRAVHRKKSLSTSRDQLLYLQALFPYAPYDELMAIINTTDGPDEAAQHAYEALNPNYTGYLYLKEQTDLRNNAKATKAQRATAFSGLREALEERAMDAFRPGMYSNLSQLQEYHETVGLFALDTTEWDRAMLLPARDLAEMAFMDLPLREEPSSSSSSDRGVDDNVSNRNNNNNNNNNVSGGVQSSGGSGSSGGNVAMNGAHHGRVGRGSSGHHRARPHLLSLAMNGSNARFMDSSFVKPRVHSFDTALLTSPPAPAREKRGDKPRDGCRTPMASPSARESALLHDASQNDPHSNPPHSAERRAEEPEDTGVLYLQDSDPEFKAPIMAWAPQAIRVGPAEALRQQEGALRVFDEATFFTDPLLAREPSSILLQTPDTRPAAPPVGLAAATTSATAATAAAVASGRGGELAALLSVSPSPTPRAGREHHEPVDSATDSLPRIVREDENTNGSETNRLQFTEEEFEDYDEENDNDADGGDGNGASSPEQHRHGAHGDAQSVVIEGDASTSSAVRAAAAAAPAHAPAPAGRATNASPSTAGAENSRSGRAEESPVMRIVGDPTLHGVHDTASTAFLSDSGRRTLAEQHPSDFGAWSHSDASAQLGLQGSLRETTVETLKSRKRRPITSSEKVRQRMRKLKPVGNVVFRENAESSPTQLPADRGSRSFGPEEPPRSTAPASQPTRPSAGAVIGLDYTTRTEDDLYTDPSAGTQQPTEWTTRNSRLTTVEEGPSPPLPGSGAHTYGSAAAAAAVASATAPAAGPVSAARPIINTTIPETAVDVEVRTTPAAVASPHSPAGGAAAADNRDRVCGLAVSIPAAQPGCTSLDPAAYLNAEEERWSCIVETLKPFEDIFGAKFRCELVRCVYDDCKAIRGCLTDILQRLLHVLGQALEGKTLADGLAEEPMDVPLFGSILLSTSPVKLQELAFREHKCQLVFCEEGTRLKVKLNVKKIKLEPIQFAYIDEADAARQNRAAQQSRLKTPQPRSRAAAWTLRHNAVEKYKSGITRGTASVTVADVKVKGIVYIWLMASGKMHVTFQEAKVSVGTLTVSTDVPKLNVLFTLGSPIIKIIVERMLLDFLKSTQTF